LRRREFWGRTRSLTGGGNDEGLEKKRARPCGAGERLLGRPTIIRGIKEDVCVSGKRRTQNW